jgi:transposase
MLKYQSDISRDQFEQIREVLESARKKTKPRTVDLYDVFCGLLYVLKSGCQWRMLPKDYPKWRTVHEYFLIWGRKGADGQPSVLERALKKSGCRVALPKGAASHDQLPDC